MEKHGFDQIHVMTTAKAPENFGDIGRLTITLSQYQISAKAYSQRIKDKGRQRIQ